MKTIAFIGEDKIRNFKSNVLEFVNSYSNNYKEVTNEHISSKGYADYIVMNSNSDSDIGVLKCKYCLANMDKLFQNNICIYGNLITYGFGNKSTITVSSVENENEGFVYCLQRYINMDCSHNVEPQEIPICLKFEDEEELYCYMVAITILLIENVGDEKFFEKLLNKSLNKK
ncbi:hypothetical protein RBU49_02170 [Clostridium sp. MB40-C1]|uniref:hypothetical protein n=1 Tax=Clostridium sp. MB40-C1 TaxID=3070996 RepID=UPI0027E0D831|nr:hypothetical protein [Clostridium sp. MB40-C1]WMJ81082.1 hypothetical protein RBU49_02170 [Clostridium sp. MB40-C1]